MFFSTTDAMQAALETGGFSDTMAVLLTCFLDNFSFSVVNVALFFFRRRFTEEDDLSSSLFPASLEMSRSTIISLTPLTETCAQGLYSKVKDRGDAV